MENIAIGFFADGLIVYPSVMSADNSRLTLVNNYETELAMEVRSLTGQLVFAAHVAQGNTVMQLNKTGNLAEGVYLVNIRDEAGTVISNKKILITK